MVNGVMAPSLIAAVFAFVNLLLVFFFLKETEKEEVRQQATKLIMIKEIYRALKVEKIGLALILFFLVQTTWSLHMPVFSLFLNQRFGMGVFLSGLLLGYRGIWSALVQLFLVGRGVERFGETKLLRIAVLIMICGLFLIGISPTVVILILGLTLMEFGGDFIAPVTLGLVSKWAKPEEQGEMMGIAASMGSLGRMIGPYAGGAAFETLGISTPFFLGAILMVIGLVTLFSF